MRVRVRVLAAAVVVGAVVLATACSSDGDEDGANDGGGVAEPTSSASGPGISVGEALASDLDQPLLVNGFLVASGDGVRLCEALAESYPPQCGGESLTVEGLDLASRDDLSEEGGVSWTDQPVQLLGDVEGGVLTVAGGTSG